MRLDARKLDVAMAKQGYNMTKLAITSGISRQTISLAKSGKRIKPETVFKLSIVLNCDVEDLLEDN